MSLSCCVYVIIQVTVLTKGAVGLMFPTLPVCKGPSAKHTNTFELVYH